MVKVPMRLTMNGIRKKQAAPTAASLGTVASVLSCSDVNACITLTIKLTTTAIASTGAQTQIAASRVRRESSTTTSLDICSPQKLFISEPTRRFQPSTITNSKILSGVEITTGGNCSIPTEVVISAT